MVFKLIIFSVQTTRADFIHVFLLYSRFCRRHLQGAGNTVVFSVMFGPVHEVVPSRGVLFQESQRSVVLCKAKLLPLQSLSLEKLEQLQTEAQQRTKQSS